jgi:hypothetical protein
VTVPTIFCSADIGFRPNPHAFGFKNSALTLSWGMFRHFFGRAQVEYENGERRYDAEAFFTSSYQKFGGGCFGFSATSLLSYFATPQPFPGPFAMPHVENLHASETLADYSRPIGYYQGAQKSQSTRMLIERSLGQTPSETYQAVRNAISSGSSGILVIVDPPAAKRKSRAHALTPYRLEQGDTIARAFVYDSNYPAEGEDSERSVEFDLSENTWSYPFSDSDPWGGGATDGRIAFVPISAVLDQGVPWWRYPEDSAAEGPHSTIAATGPGGLTVSEIGSTEIPEGALDMAPIASESADRPSSAWAVPADRDYIASYTSDVAEPMSLSVVGQGVSLTLASGPVPELGLEVRDAAENLRLTIPTGVSLATSLARDLEGQGRAAHWTFASGPGGTYSFRADRAGDKLSVACEKGSTPYDVIVEARGTGSGSRRVPGVSLREGESHYVNPVDWSDLPGADVAIGIDRDADGVVDTKVVATHASVVVDPRRINARALGNFVTVSIELPWEWRAAAVDPGSVRLAATLAPVGPSGVSDTDGDGIPEFRVKFSRAAVTALLGIGDHTVRFSGRATLGSDSLYFEGDGAVSIFK